tara:strand:- start:1395 stop:2051 length:657 start_codon:yes stop_codon:yes gene_type:complete
MGLKEKTINLNEKLKKNFSKNKETLNKVKENLGKKIKSISENKDNFSRVKKNIEKKIKNFFDWVKGAELVELEKCDTTDDPVRPELSNEFRTSFGRKIYGVKYQGEIHAVMCFAFTNEIPKSVIELEQYSKDAFLQSAQRDQNVGKIAIAYTVWSKKKGGGKLIVKEVYKMIKKSNHLNRLVTLSPLTEMARRFHLRNGAVELQVNQETQNFEYKVIK